LYDLIFSLDPVFDFAIHVMQVLQLWEVFSHVDVCQEALKGAKL
jgi:hypothetical protein